ncbi:MAG: hypothetical protein A2138_21415 [Deltaproteobacteria bacterium RBG_16_71_12]|nr:MAG: hypothetical protein A2138_21415 [Deltaproteobacteria bacterium RBG_16_71_12]
MLDLEPRRRQRARRVAHLVDLADPGVVEIERAADGEHVELVGRRRRAALAVVGLTVDDQLARRPVPAHRDVVPTAVGQGGRAAGRALLRDRLFVAGADEAAGLLGSVRVERDGFGVEGLVGPLAADGDRHLARARRVRREPDPRRHGAALWRE